MVATAADATFDIFCTLLLRGYRLMRMATHTGIDIRNVISSYMLPMLHAAVSAALYVERHDFRYAMLVSADFILIRCFDAITLMPFSRVMPPARRDAAHLPTPPAPDA